MKPMRVVALVTLAAALMTGGAGAAKEPSWGKVRADFLQDFKAVQPKDRMHAIYDHLEGQDRPEVVRLLTQAVLAEEDESAMVVKAAVEILGDLREDAAVLELARISGKGPTFVRLRALEALGGCGTSPAIERLREALDDKTLEIRIVAAAALGRAKRATAVPVLTEALEDEAWPVRAAAAQALRRIGSEDALAPMIVALGRETGRVREDLRDALVRTAKVNLGMSFATWRRWYEDRGEELEFERRSIAPEPVPPTVVYHGIPTWARRVVFVFDVSKSMREDARVGRDAIPKEVREDGGEELARWQALETKMDWARAHLVPAIRTMRPEVEFGLVVYNQGTTPVFSGRLLPATPDNREKAITRIAGLSPSGDTDLYKALDRAFRIPESRTRMGRNLLEGPGTIYFMTDGFSSKDVPMPEGNRIAEEVERWNVIRRVRVNCVGIGLHDSGLLGQVSSDSGGAYQTLD